MVQPFALPLTPTGSGNVIETSGLWSAPSAPRTLRTDQAKKSLVQSGRDMTTQMVGTLGRPHFPVRR
jgi:hypothetical protein